MSVSRRVWIKSLCCTLLMGIGVLNYAHADTWSDIEGRKQLLVGIDLTAPPYGMTDGKMQPQGIDVDVAKALAKDWNKELKIVQVTGPNRIPFLMTRKVDMVIASFGVTKERAKVVDFSNPYSVNMLVVGASKSVAIDKLSDLSDKRIAVVRGNLQDIELTKVAPKGAKIVRYDDDSTAITAFMSGQADALASPAIMFPSLAERDPSKNIEIKVPLKSLPLSIGIRKNDLVFKQHLNEWISQKTKDGTLNTIFKKWTKTELPDMVELAKQADEIVK